MNPIVKETFITILLRSFEGRVKTWVLPGILEWNLLLGVLGSPVSVILLFLRVNEIYIKTDVHRDEIRLVLIN